MKITDIYESTTSGSVATVASPMTGGMQKRNFVGKGVYGNEKAGSLMTGKKTNKKYANSVNESKEDRERNRLMQMATDYEEKAKKTKSDIKKDHYRKMADDIRSKIKTKDNVSEGKMKQLATDIRDMDNGNFQKKYKKSKEQMKAQLGNSSPVTEAHLEEDDLIIVPGQGHRLKSGFIPHGASRLDHEVEMARSDLFSAAKNAKQVYELIADLTEEEGLEGWVQEKIIKANDYLNSIREYLEGKKLQNEMGVIAGGAGNFEEASKPGLWANIHAKRERIKKGSGERMRKPGSKGAPSAQDFKDAANEGIVDKIKGAVRREKAKDLPLIQTRRDYAMGKAGDAYEKGQTRKGNQYMAWAERDRKKKGDRTTNPAGTYRTKTSDYTNEGKYGKGMRDCCDSPAQQGQPHIKGCKSHTPTARDRRDDMERHNRETIPGYKSSVAEAQSMGTALKNTLAKAEPGSKLDNSIKAHNRDIKNGGKGTLKNAPTGYHFDKKGYCRLGDK